MSRSPWLRLIAVALASSLTASAASAGPIWSYSVEPANSNIHSDPVFYPLAHIPIWPPTPWPPPHAGEADIHLKGAHGHGNGSTDLITLAWVTPHSLAPDILPGKFADAPWSLKLTITDPFLHKSGTLLFTGDFTGSVSKNHESISSKLTSERTQDLVLGGPFIFDDFTVKFDRFIPPHGDHRGRFIATVDVDRLAAGFGVQPFAAAAVIDPQPLPASDTPEPASAALAVIGLAGAGLFRRLRGRC